MQETQKQMLESLGINDVDELFSDIPEKIRSPLDLSQGMDEFKTVEHVDSLLEKNEPIPPGRSFLGHGCYYHNIPSLVSRITGRGEFLTSYTPYQSEISQGMLQALYEYQSITAELTGLPGTNSSMYDLPTAIAESLLMASRVTRKSKLLIPKAMADVKKKVIRTYTKGPRLQLVEYDYLKEEGTIDLDGLEKLSSQDVAGVYVESPNLFGLFETELDSLRGIFPKSLLIMGSDPLALSIMKTPAEMDFDVAVANGQVLGNPPGFGGPHLGIFTCKTKYTRKMPGRVIGKTVDANGETSYCMTLQTREQHIRRSKATSNICTNNALCALAFAVHASYLNGDGMVKMAKKNMAMTSQWRKKLSSLDRFDGPLFNGTYFNEFPLKFKGDLQELMEKMRRKKYLLGYPLEKDLYGLKNVLLTCATEVNSVSQMDSTIESLKEVV